MNTSGSRKSTSIVLLYMVLFAHAISAAGVEPETVEPQHPSPTDHRHPAMKQVELSPVVRRLLDDPLTLDQERRALLIFHGQWAELDNPTRIELAELALLRGDYHHEALLEKSTPAVIRGAAALARGEPQSAITVLVDQSSAQAALLRARAYEQLGRIDEAVNNLQPWRQRLQNESIHDAKELTAAAQALVLLARLEGRPSQDYHLAISLLGKVREEIDPLYWPAHIAEADVLMEKDNHKEAMDALSEALALNPNSSDAWYRLGRLSVEGFDFKGAAHAAAKLRAIHRTHLLADLLDAQMFLQQRDAQGARAVLKPALDRFGTHRELLALQAASIALTFDEQALQAALKEFDRLTPGTPGNPMAHFLAGKFLSSARQYEMGQAMLRVATERQPNWPAPWIELGLLLMQAGQDEEARVALGHAAQLDPFNRRANNQLKLVEAILEYERLETEHFVIRYKRGIDEVLARDMPDQLEQIYREITTAFGHRPKRKTYIDIMSDEEHFGVRITGMPEIWTIAASTGPVIAITPPRSGSRQRGTYHWVNVVRHEFVHTVTLSRTRNRIPHWFTEACAVSQEITGRDYETCKLLDSALHNDELFPLDQINWRFVRPRSPRDRPLAYAQSEWMLQYTTEVFGHHAILELLDLFRQATSDTEALECVTGKDPDEFMRDFKRWAVNQTTRWGLGVPPEDERLKSFLSGRVESPSEAELESLLREHPNQPDLLRLMAERSLVGAGVLPARPQAGPHRPVPLEPDPAAAPSEPQDPGLAAAARAPGLPPPTPVDLETARLAVLRYAAARPVDPWPHRALIKLATLTGRTEEAVASLEYLEQQDGKNGIWAFQLAHLHRVAGRIDRAAWAIRRGLHREPYNPGFRQLAATIDLQRGDLDAALYHLVATAKLEPDRAIHHTRLAVIYHRLGRSAEAHAAAERARELDPKAPVDDFMN